MNNSKDNQSKNSIKLLCLGDIVGRSARNAIKETILPMRSNYDLIIANGENAAGGIGLNAKTANELFQAGIDVITLGDHAWQHKDFFDYLNKHTDTCIRPANFPSCCAGRGWTIVEIANIKIGIFNLIGRVFMQSLLECPFQTSKKIILESLTDCKIKICDIHAEATSEKIALARFLDGQVSLIFGTHTHVQTADDTILPHGTGYISDVGMCGSCEGVIGMDTETALSRFLTGIQYSYKLAKGKVIISGISCTIDCKTGKATEITRLNIPYYNEKI